MEPAPETAARIARVTGKRPVRWRRVFGGYGPAERWAVGFEDDTSVFVKISTTEYTEKALRAEHANLGYLRAPWAPVELAYDEDGPPLIVLEDLSHAEWPPPWTTRKIDRVLETLDDVSRTPPPPGARDAAEIRDKLAGWAHVAEDPRPFLSLGLATAAWLERALPGLLAIDETIDLGGDALCHFDVRSDNLCFDGPRTVLVDWNFASVARRGLDVATWLPSLHSEGGPAPETILADAGDLAAFLAGYFSWKAGLPPEWLPGGERVRAVQLSQLRSALPWAVRALGLPPLDGARA